MRPRWFLAPLFVAQLLLGVRVLARLARSAGRTTIQPVLDEAALSERVSVVLPVLNEEARLAPCLEGLIAQGSEVREILVVDGGSTDGTRALVERYGRRDPRVRLLDASPVPDNWNGKAWGLHVGVTQGAPATDWILTVDADVRPAAPLARSLLTHASQTRLSALSVATEQEIAGAGEGIVHPALLTTLVYRFGIPGQLIRRASDVQANGQCFLVRRAALERVGGFAAVHDSICEDVTLARRLVSQGEPLGFFEADGLVRVRMYDGWRATWRDWSRSLPMRDRFFGARGWLGLLEVTLVQALPLPLLALLRLTGRPPRALLVLNGALLAARLGVLAGTARAYRSRPWSYWLSPLADLPAAIQLIRSALRRHHVWRGRALVRGGL
jgi:dolichol-phosphate mannosyltransferase